MKKSPRRPKPAPYAWGQVLHYANAAPTTKNWTAILLRSRREIPIQPTYGFSSLEELVPVLERFRNLLSRLVAMSRDEAERSMILDVINERAEGKLHGWTWYRGTGRVFPQIRTQNESFEETLYAQLAVALTAESFTSIKQCKSCSRFFYEPRRRTAALCSTRCRAKAAKDRTARYRESHPEEYREYQRRLMAKRRRGALS